MTTVTKIFVVLVCLFAFIFTPMAIQFAARTHDWKTLADDNAQNAITAMAHERSVIATSTSTIEHLNTRLEDGRKLIKEKENTITGLEQEKKTNLLKIHSLEGERGSWEKSAATLSGQLEVILGHNQNLIKENGRLAQSELELNSRNIELHDRLEALMADNVILVRQLKQRIEEIAHMRAKNEQLREASRIGLATGPELSAAPTPSGGPAATPAARKIEGLVVRADNAQGLVSIDVGSASGVAKDITMVVVRQVPGQLPKYICDLIITGEISTNGAVGRIDGIGDRQVRPDDRVFDARSFMAGNVEPVSP